MNKPLTPKQIQARIKHGGMYYKVGYVMSDTPTMGIYRQLTVGQIMGMMYSSLYKIYSMKKVKPTQADHVRSMGRLD